MNVCADRAAFTVHVTLSVDRAAVTVHVTVCAVTLTLQVAQSAESCCHSVDHSLSADIDDVTVHIPWFVAKLLRHVTTGADRAAVIAHDIDLVCHC